MSFEDDLRTLVRARYPIIWVQTHEEERVLRYVLAVARNPTGADGKAPAKPMFLWSQSRGWEEVQPDGSRKVVDGELVDPIAAIQRVITEAEGESGRLFVLRDAHRFFSETMPFYRFLRDAAHVLRTSKATLVVTSPLANLPTEVEKDVVVLDLPLPTGDELRVRLDEVLEGLDSKIEHPKNGQVERILKAGLGLSEDEFAGAVKESLVRARKVDPRVIIKQKEQIIRKSGVVELFSSVEGLESVGGLDLLRDWIEQRALAFSEKAAKFGLRAPKGLFLTGPPGTGKTLTAKAAANYLGVPLLWVKADAIFGRYVGESEGNMRRVLKLADAVAPCVLFIDECEKLIAGSGGSQSAGDSGVARRVFGQLLSYLQERQTPVFTIATANDPLGLPPELVSRFDATFFVDFPQPMERADIIAIHLKKVHRDAKNYDLEELVRVTEGFSGREVEQAVNEALFTAFAEGKELSDQHLVGAFTRMTPISKSRRNEVEAMREWARVNARPASVVNRLGAKKAEVEL
jgi:ATP-dependent 26S proteasome regulatory subunit